MSAEVTGAAVGRGAVGGGAGGDALSFTTDGVAVLAREIEQHASVYREKWAAVPDVSATACGQGFAAHGARLQQAAARLRAHGQAMYAGLESHGPAIRRQWEKFASCDGDVAAGVAAIADVAGIEVSD